MKTLRILSVIAFVIAKTHAIDATAWQYEQPFHVNAPGITRLELPAETINASSPYLVDLRILSPSGMESPYVIERATLTPARSATVRDFKTSISGNNTVIEFETGSADAIEAVVLDTPAASFIKSARVDASADGAQWNEIAKNEVVFRQTDGASRLRIPLASASHGKLRVTIDDNRTQPVPFTAAHVEFTNVKPVTSPHAATIIRTEEKPRQTEFTVALGSAKLHLTSLRLAAADPVFSRKVTVSYVADDHGVDSSVIVAVTSIYRVTTNDGLGSEMVEIPIHQILPVSEIKVTVNNGDSPPLHVTGISAMRRPVSLVFFAQESGMWKLLTGNNDATAPKYDIETLGKQLRQVNAATALPGKLAANPNYKRPPALPDVHSEGANIDLTKWHYRKPVTTTQAGVIRVELDATTIAHAQSSLGDLRLIQNEKQIPFLLDHTHASRTLQPKLAKDSDPKRPTVSLWRVTMPLDDLPATQLAFNSPTPLFERTLLVWAKTKEQLGNEYRTHLGTARWTKQTGSKNGELVMSLSSARLPEVFFIETDNGDNPPIEIESVLVQHAVNVVIAKITDSAPVFLYYGNNFAYAPRYDLQLVRAELLNAQKQNATMGAEEVLRAEVKSSSDISSGSPWLWAALGVVIVVLLWVVSKMLPAAPADK